MQHRARDLPAQDAGMVELEKALHEHLARPVEAGRERCLLCHRTGRGGAGVEPGEQITKAGVALVAQDQSLRDRIAERPDAELKRTAIRHDAGDPQPGGVFGEIDRLARRRKQREICLRAVEHHVEGGGVEVALARHERQLAVDLPDEDKIGGFAATFGQEIEDDVRIAAEAISGGAVADPLGHQLPHHVDATLQHGAERMGVIGRDIALLCGRHVEPGAGLEEELVDFDIGRQAMTLRRRVGEVRITVEATLRDRADEAPLQLRAGMRLRQRQRRENPQADARGPPPRVQTAHWPRDWPCRAQAASPARSSCRRAR